MKYIKLFCLCQWSLWGHINIHVERRFIQQKKNTVDRRLLTRNKMKMLCGSFRTQTNRKQYNILFPYICIIHFCQQQQKNAYKTHIVRISVKTVNKEKKIHASVKWTAANTTKKKWNEKNRVFALHEKIITDIWTN